MLGSRASHGGLCSFNFRRRHGQGLSGLESHVPWQGADPPGERASCSLHKASPTHQALGLHWLRGRFIFSSTVQLAPVMADIETTRLWQGLEGDGDRHLGSVVMSSRLGAHSPEYKPSLCLCDSLQVVKMGVMISSSFQ